MYSDKLQVGQWWNPYNIALKNDLTVVLRSFKIVWRSWPSEAGSLAGFGHPTFSISLWTLIISTGNAWYSRQTTSEIGDCTHQAYSFAYKTPHLMHKFGTPILGSTYLLTFSHFRNCNSCQLQSLIETTFGNDGYTPLIAYRIMQNWHYYMIAWYWLQTDIYMYCSGCYCTSLCWNSKFVLNMYLLLFTNAAV